jgi:NodT family efflux transporter outer membrane factor (OMF) lipoprotein
MERIALPCLGAFLAASCALFSPPERDPRSVSPVPEDYGPNTSAGSSVPNRWWKAFDDNELDRLVMETLANNQSLARSAARLKQARALARQKGVGRWPELDLEASVSSTEQHVEDRPTGDDTQTWETYGLGLALSYELDLWGRVDAIRRAADLDAFASGADLETAAMTLSAETALRYFETVAVRQTIDILDNQLDTNQEILDLIELRFMRSRATALDVLDQREVVAQTESLIPPQQAREKSLLRELSVLQGRPPSEEAIVESRELPRPPPAPDSGIPADLLSRRPDVKAAWQRLRAADWGVASARADRMPAIRLTAAGGYESDSVDTLFDNWIINLAASLTAPLFDAGRRKAEVERQRAIVEERVAAYRETVLRALKETQDALSNEHSQAERLDALDRQLELAALSREQALMRYGQGRETYLRVLTALNKEQSLRRSMVQAEYELLVYRVQLYRALGGDWGAVVEETGREEAPSN